MAIYDRDNERLVLSRDRLGKKPLYFMMDENRFLFASEIKAILACPGVLPAPNYKKIYRYLAGNYRYIDCEDESYFSGISSVPKASYLIADTSLKLTQVKYWSLTPREVKAQKESERIKDFQDLMIDSVRIRLRSDVPVSCMLSGGMDSTSVACISHRVLKHPIKTFSGITGEAKGIYDESEFIDEVVEWTGAEHTYLKPDPADLFATVEEMLGFHDEPICTVTWHSLYLISKKIQEMGYKVVLNGHGGDELLAGYWDHYHYNFHDLHNSGSPDEYNHEILSWKQNHNRNPHEIENMKDYIDDLFTGKRDEKSRFPDYSSCFQDDFVKQFKNNCILINPHKEEPLLSKRLYFDLMFETVPALIRAEDRNTMACSIESRSPFLDYRLTEFCFSLENRLKIRDGIGKWILREAMRGILPEKVRTRKDKAGFISPADEWFRTNNKTQIEELLNNPSELGKAIYNLDNIRNIFQEHLKNKANHQMFLWQFINLELWFKKFFI